MTGRQAAISFVAEDHACLHPGRSAAILDRNQRVGWIGRLHPEVERKLEIAIRRGFSSLQSTRASDRSAAFTEISRFPAVRRDLAIVVDESVTLDELRDSVHLAAKACCATSPYSTSTAARG